MKTAIFLGAGASAAEGAPIQSDLFSEYFNNHDQNSRHPNYSDMFDEVSKFFLEMFDIQIDQPLKNSGALRFPTFEEVLGTLDLASQRKEAFKFMSTGNASSKSGEIERMRLAIVLLMAHIIQKKLINHKGHHRKLIQNLNNIGELKNICFVSTNYDIVIDNALSEESGYEKIDYGIDLELENNTRQTFQSNFGTPLYKIHGSLNWLYCPSCNKIRLTPFRKGVVSLVDVMSGIENKGKCSKCGQTYSPVIVPPTFYKDFTNVNLSIIWSKVEQTLIEANQIIFCGYSFPDSDIHIKYILKRAQKNRLNGKSLKVKILNNYKGKKKASKDEERARFARYLGSDIQYLNKSFEQFAAKPVSILQL